MSIDHVENLDYRELQDLASLMMYHADHNARARIMAKLPTVYAKLNPEVSNERIIGFVLADIEAGRESLNETLHALAQSVEIAPQSFGLESDPDTGGYIGFDWEYDLETQHENGAP